MHSNPDDRRTLLHSVVSGGAALLLIVSPQAHAQGSFAELNGVRLYYDVQGSGPALVLVHGWAINSDYWEDQLPAFREKYRVIRYDRRGFGRSSGDPDITADPVDLKALLTHLGEEKAFVVGHSAGSATSMAFAVHYPESTVGLILTGGGGVSDYATGGLAAARAAQAERRRIARSYGIDSLFAQVGAGPAHSRDSLTAEQKARTGRMLATYRATDLFQDLMPSGRTRRVVLADLPNVHVPTLLLIGERETPNVLERTEDMARRMPNAKRVVLHGGGHLVNLSQVTAYNEAVLRFLAEAQQGPGPVAQSGNLDVDDARIYYQSAGRGTAVVLIHGWALNLRAWDDQIAALRPGFRVVAFDRRGYGRSTGFADTSADPGDLRALLDTLGIQSAVLVGHSAGAEVAYRFAAAFPDRARGLVLYGAGMPPQGFPIAPSQDQLQAMQLLPTIARRHGLDSLRKFLLTRPGFTGLRTPELQARIDAMWATYSGKDLLEDHPPSDRFPPARFDDVKRWPVPTLFVIGDREDPYIRLTSDSLARWMPNARSVVIPGGGHGVHFQQPERFNAVLLGFLAEITRRH